MPELAYEEVYVQINCQAYFTGRVPVPKGLSREEKLAWLKRHPDVIDDCMRVSGLNPVDCSYTLDEEESEL